MDIQGLLKEGSKQAPSSLVHKRVLLTVDLVGFSAGGADVEGHPSNLPEVGSPLLPVPMSSVGCSINLTPSTD